MNDTVLRVYEARRDAARARLAREEAALRILMAGRAALEPAAVPDGAQDIEDLALFFRHEARKHRELLDLEARIDAQGREVASARAAEQEQHRRLRMVERLLERRARAARRTRETRAARELEDRLLQRREGGR